MNIGELHTQQQKEISLVPFFDCQGTVSAMRILAGKTLKKHITKTPALLVCVTGRVVFKNEKGIEQSLSPGDYVEIEPMVQHWVDGLENSNLLLIK
jgi:quercetin dioxygenase-like cupin family protein